MHRQCRHVTLVMLQSADPLIVEAAAFVASNMARGHGADIEFVRPS